MIKKSRNVDNGGETVSAVLTDLSEAFEYNNHSLLTPKLNAYSAEKRLPYSRYPYLTRRKQRTKTESSFSPWEMLLSEIPQEVLRTS